MTEILINISNHSSTKWSQKQKLGFEKIIDVAFPNVPAEATEDDILVMVRKLRDEIIEIKKEYKISPVKIMLQGEYTLCYLLKNEIDYSPYGTVTQWYIPATERKVIEKVKDDGTVEKISSFEFVKWRMI